MGVYVTFCFAFFFFFVAHSTLLHFRSEEAEGHPIPLRELILPLPGKGKAVAALAATLGMACLILCLGFAGWPAREGEWMRVARAWPLAACFVGFPILFQGIYVARRLTRFAPFHEGRLMYLTRPCSPGEFRAPLVLAAAVNGVGMLLHRWLAA